LAIDSAEPALSEVEWAHHKFGRFLPGAGKIIIIPFQKEHYAKGDSK